MIIFFSFLLGITLSGTVSLNNNPYSDLSRSIVFVDSINSGLICTTDSDGAYSITVSADTYDIYFTRSAYYSKTMSSVVISGDTTIDEELRYKAPISSNRPHYEFNRYTNVTTRTFFDILNNLRVGNRAYVKELYSPYYNGLYGIIENMKKVSGDTAKFIVYEGLDGDSISYADTAGYALDYPLYAGWGVNIDGNDTISVDTTILDNRYLANLLGEARATSANYKSFWR